MAEVKNDNQDSGNGDHLDDSDLAGGGQVDDVTTDVQPVPQPRLRLVEPVPQKAKRGQRASGSTRGKKSNVEPVAHSRKARNVNDLHPPTITGCKWKPSGLTGWELYTRRPAISKNGKRSSKHKYVAYYSQETVKEFYAHREKTANLRRA